MKIFEELQEKHEFLLRANEENIINVDIVSDFVDEMISESKNINSPRERSQLRANLKHWANYLYEKTGVFPQVELLPSPWRLPPLPIVLGITIFGSVFLLILVNTFLSGIYGRIDPIQPATFTPSFPVTSTLPISITLIPRVTSTPLVEISPTHLLLDNTPAPPTMVVVLWANKYGGNLPLSVKLTAENSYMQFYDGTKIYCTSSICTFIWSVIDVNNNRIVATPTPGQESFTYTFYKQGLYFVRVTVCLGSNCSSTEIQFEGR